MIGRAILLWIVIILVEFVHGILRTLFLTPRVGDWRSRQIGVLTGTVIFFGIALAGVGWLRATSVGGLFAAGGVWVVLTLAFEILFGRYGMRMSWRRIGREFDLRQGGLMTLGLAALAASPWLAAVVRGLI